MYVFPTVSQLKIVLNDYRFASTLPISLKSQRIGDLRLVRGSVNTLHD